MLLRRLAFRRLPVFLYCCLLLGSLLSTATPAISEVTLDGSLGSRGPVSSGALPNGTQTTYLISDNLGRRAGGNLFHSFDRFNVSRGESASFTGSNDIRNVVGRVTGGSASSIDGILRSTIDGANLYLLNPSGILFGPNASLDVRGSFHASTADYLRFSDGGIFYANPNAGSVLSVASVEAFGFLSANPAPISIEQSTLRVPDGKTLSVIGGNISVTSGSTGYLYAPGGQVHLASVASPGELIPTASSGPQVSSFERLGDVSLTGAYVDASGTAGGSVFIRGGRLVFTDSTLVANTVGANGAAIGADIQVRGDLSMNNSMLQVATTGAGNAGDINIESSAFQMRNMAIIGDITTGTGRGGNLEVTTGSLSMIEGAQLLVSTYGAGNSGNLKITADTATLSSADNFSRPAALFANTRTGSTGRGGNMELNIGDLTLLKGAQLDTTTSGRGNAGQLTINADNILFSGKNGRNYAAGLFARTMANPGGNAGPVTINTGSLEVRDGAQISSGSYGGGSGGNLVINADRLLISSKDNTGTSWNNSTGIFKRGSYGSSGAMTITAGDLQVLDGGTINTLIDRSGAGGDMVLNADRIVISGAAPGGIGSMVYYSTNATATGAMGNAKMNCDSLDVTAGGQVYVKNLGSGTSGNLEINASGRVLLTPVDGIGVNTSRTTGLLVQGYSRDAGKIIINADSLSILDGAAINTLASGAGRGGDVDITAGRVVVSASRINSQSGPTATGSSGDIRINGGSLEVTEGAEITVQTSGKGNAGNISIEADSVLVRGKASNTNLVFSMIDASTSSSGDGGNIQINAKDIVLENVWLIESYTTGTGKAGSIRISTEDMRMRDPHSHLSAGTGGAGTGGTIHIEARNLEMEQGAHISASSGGPGTGGAIEIVSDRLAMSGAAGIETNASSSGKAGSVTISAANMEMRDIAHISSATSASGAAGDVKISAGTFDLEYNAGIYATTSGSGMGGVIDITADRASLSGPGIFSCSYGTGDAGQIRVSAGILDMKNVSHISAGSYNTGNAGAISIDVDRLTLTGSSYIQSDTANGRGGDISIRAAQGVYFSSASIATNSTGSSNAGSIVITTPGLSMMDYADIQGTSTGSGSGGNITLNVTNLDMGGSARIRTDAHGGGKGGAISIDASGTFSMSGPLSQVSANAWSTGDGGNIGIRAGEIYIGHESAIMADALGASDGGTISIRSANQFTLDKGYLAALAHRGRGGDITVDARDIQIANDSAVSASSFGAGNAGNIRISAADSVFLRDSAISTSARRADGGNIDIQAGNMIRLMDAGISASVGGGPQTTGGNISIDPNFVVLGNSRIIANAYEGHGGSVKIVANTFLADPYSSVDASSALGIDGTVDIQAPITNVSGLLSPLSQEFVNATALLREPCMARLKGGKYSSFIVGGRDALPLEPGGPLPGIMH